MKQRIYEDLWRRLGKFAPAEGTEAWTEFDGELYRLAVKMADITCKMSDARVLASDRR